MTRARRTRARQPAPAQAADGGAVILRPAAAPTATSVQVLTQSLAGLSIQDLNSPKLLLKEFEEQFVRTRPNDKQVWQDLCQLVHPNLETVPDSIKECKQKLSRLKGPFINLFNLLQHICDPRGNVPLMRFKNYGQFQQYTSQNETFPRKVAKKSKFLKIFLRGL